jgi:hypothetical protein
MPYQVDRYNGTIFSTVPDQTVDSSSCDIKLVGKNYAGYGEIQNENFLHLLEHFRSEFAPRRPIVGQIWYDELNNKLKFRDYTNTWKTTAIVDVSTTAPTGLAARDKGNVWYNDTLKQINVWDGTNYVVIGPEIAVNFGETKLTSSTIRDNGNTQHAIIKIYSDDEVIGTISNEEYGIGDVDEIDGFTTIKKGITLINTPASGVTSSTHRFWGTASNALKFDGKTTADFVLRTGSGSTFDDTGFSVGNDSDIKIFVEDTNKPVISNQVGSSIRVRIMNGTIKEDVGIFDVTGMIPGINDTYNLGSSIKKWNEVHATDLFGNVRGSVTGSHYAEDDSVMINGVTKELFGSLTGSIAGNVRALDNSVAYDGSTKTFTGSAANFLNSSIDTLTVINQVVGDLKGDIYANDNTIAYNAGTKQFTGSLVGNATTSSKFLDPKYINGVAFDGSANITIEDDTKVAKLGSSMTGYLTLVGAPTQPNHAATKQYVDDKVASRTLFFSLDTKGLLLSGAGAGSVVAILNQLAPTENFLPGTRAHIASTIQNVQSVASLQYQSRIGSTYLVGVAVQTTVQNPTRNNLLIYQVNSSRTSWEYVSG